MKNIDYSNQIQKEAILNECKGNMFEFLVTQALASRSCVEDHFLLNLPNEFKLKLGSYEELMRIHDPKLLVKLPSLAQNTVKRLWEELFLDKYSFIQWKVIGKIVATNDNEFWNETDIVGTYLNAQGVEKHLSLSLKLTKDHSYTNTKSGGVKSFLTKYFSPFGDIATNFQRELNLEVDESFLMMGHKLYSLNDLEFQGSFDSKWTDSYTELPGELPAEMKAIVHENYHRVAKKLSTILDQLKKLDSYLFFDSLASLCGFGSTDIIQVSCFHHDYELKDVTINNFHDYFSDKNKECVLLAIKDLASSIDVIMGKLTLQIRVKPMNKFTTAAYKINCSIKVKA